jgi:hypothetical protein
MKLQTHCLVGAGQFSKYRWQPMAWVDISAEFVVAAAQVRRMHAQR